MINRQTIAAAAAMLLLSTTASLATENGLEHYPLGVNTAMPGFVPPPGEFVWLNYNEVYTANTLAGPDGKSLLPGFRLTVFAEAARFIYTWPVTWDNLTFSSQIVPTFVGIDINPVGREFSRFSFGDLNIVPVYVGWHNDKIHTIFGLNIWLPTGYYQPNDPSSAGLNYYTFGPEWGFTYIPTPKWELSFDAITQFNTVNPKTNYQSGASFNLDYGLGYRPLAEHPQFQVGLVGNIYQQFTNDTISGNTVLDGNRGRTFSVGPQLRYDIGHGGLLIKWEHELGVENQTSGNRFWLQFALPFSL